MPLSACASTGMRAALVVDPGEEGDPYRFCVQLPDESVSGIELIQLAGEQHGLTYELGNGGQSVCMLAGVGSSSGNECFGEYPDFWGYWRGDDGSWEWSGTGAGSTVVEAGDVEGWSWGRGQDGSTHPAPPPTRFDSVCTVVDEGDEARSDESSRSERATGGSAAPEAAPEGRPQKGPEVREPREERAPADRPGTAGRSTDRTRLAAGRSRSSPATPAAAASGEAEPGVLPARASDRPPDAMPAGAIAAMGLGVVLVYAGIRVTRRRKT